MITTPTSGAADLPEALRLAAAISNLLCSNEAAARTLAAAADELVRLHAESEMRRAALLDEMQNAALAAGQATAAPAQPVAQQPHRSGCTAGTDEACVQRGCGTNCPAVSPRQGAAYAALPTSSYAGRVYEEGFLVGTCPLYTADQLRAFADVTHALRASHGQALVGAASSAVLKAIREANMQLVRTGDDAFMLVPYKAVTAQAADSVTAPAPPPECETEAEKRAFAFGWFKALESERMKAESVQEDAARYRFLRDGEWRDTDLEQFIRLQLNTLWDAKIDAARKQGANHD